MTDPVVYIDDEEDLCRIFRLLVGRETGAAVETFTDPFKALEYLETHPASAVLCDFRMPQLTGLDVLERMKNAAPFFLISGDLYVQDLVGNNPRVAGVIRKPISPPQLIDLVRPFLERAPKP